MGTGLAQFPEQDIALAQDAGIPAQNIDIPGHELADGRVQKTAAELRPVLHQGEVSGGEDHRI